ncbi:MAG: glycosyltransferase family 39 protein [Patescibacteria group bacterium]
MKNWGLVVVIAIAAIIRLWSLGSDELVFDEGLYAFRSIGYLDYLESPSQTTPIQWLADKPQLPLWLNFSFHDHPPLFFLIQYLFFEAFGDSLMVARLPSALAGIGAVILLFLITSRLLKNKLAGLFSAAIMAVSFASVSVARLSMMESLLFFLVLLNILFFLKFLEMDSAGSPRDKKYWRQFGLTLGLAFLTKYVAFFLIPTYFVYLLICRRDLFRNRYLYQGLILAILVFSPVIIYNLYSYQTFGHFDLQFGYLLKQKLPWDTAAIGGKTQEPFSNIFSNLSAIYSIPFLIISALGFFIALANKKLRQNSWLIILATIFMTLLFGVIGSAIRFVAMYALAMSFFSGVTFLILWDKKQKIAIVVLSLFLIYELASSINFIFLNPPDYGVVKLDKYFDSVLGNARAEIIPTHSNPHLNKVIQKFAAGRPATLKPTGPDGTVGAGIIYDDNIAAPSMLWLFSRRQYYQGLPIMPTSAFQEKIKTDPSVFNGFELYFIKGEPAAPLKPLDLTGAAAQIEQSLIQSKLNPTAIIKTSSNNIAFKVYKFSLR